MSWASEYATLWSYSCFLCKFRAIMPNCHIKVIQGSLGVKHLRTGSESHGIFNTKFHSYPIKTFQVIPFLRSFFTIPGEKVLSPEKAERCVLLTEILILGLLSNILAAIKQMYLNVFFLLKLIFSCISGSLFKANMFRCICWKCFKIKHQMYLAFTYHTSKFQPLAFIGAHKNDFLNLGLALFT